MQQGGEHKVARLGHDALRGCVRVGRAALARAVAGWARAAQAARRQGGEDRRRIFEEGEPRAVADALLPGDAEHLEEQAQPEADLVREGRRGRLRRGGGGRAIAGVARAARDQGLRRSVDGAAVAPSRHAHHVRLQCIVERIGEAVGEAAEACAQPLLESLEAAAVVAAHEGKGCLKRVHLIGMARGPLRGRQAARALVRHGAAALVPRSGEAALHAAGARNARDPALRGDPQILDVAVGGALRDACAHGPRKS